MNKPKNDLEVRILMLRLENAVADKRWITACANYDLEVGQGWSCDWSKHIEVVDKIYSEILDTLGGGEAMEALIE